MHVHWHGSIDNILLYGFSAILVINGGRLIAGWMVKRGGSVAKVGEAIGALV